MRNLRELGTNGKTFINGWVGIPNSFVTEVMAKAGYDGITIDMQHGMHDVTSMLSCMQAIQAGGLVPTVRVPWNEPTGIGKALDAGARGIICPMINNREEAKRLTSYCFFPPIGVRSFGPVRIRLYNPITPEFTKTANAEILCMPMIETLEAVDNLDSILDVEGIGGVYVGPADLGVSMGIRPMVDREEPEILKIIDKILAAVRKRKQVAGIACGTGAYAARAAEMGFQFVSIASDSGLLFAAAQDGIKTARSKIKNQLVSAQ